MATNNSEPALQTIVREGTKHFVSPYKMGWGLVVLMLVIIPTCLLLPLNVYGHYKSVAGVTLVSFIAIWFFGISPLMTAYAGIAGGIWGAMNDQLSLREGVEQGIRTLFRALTLASFVFALEGMMAFFVSFGQNASAYLGIILLGIVGTMLGLVFKTPTKFCLWLVSILLVIFVVMMLFGGRIAIPASKDVTAGEMASTASATVSGAVSSIASKATASSSTSAVGGSQVFELPAEGGIVTLRPGVVSILKMPTDTLGYRNFIVDATDEEKRNDSYLGFITENRPGSGHDLIRWIPNDAAIKAAGKTEIRVFVEPRSAADRLKEAMAE